MANTGFSPKAFLRARRPERFSDSATEEGPVLDRSILEYHLDTLTSRNQEAQFHLFARRLAEREICPNLLPQTGPVGGGDSKVDAETYPVSDALSLVWYGGTGREAASERWGFAFSTKKDWRAKLRSDIAKIAATSRGYTKAFFMSSQFIPDKVRAKAEDELRATHGLDVRILDRTWILDRVFTGRHEALAIEELGLATSVRSEFRRGPLDTQRDTDLVERERRIELAVQQGDNGSQLVDDCIKAATLARDLERPRAEVDGRFLRAQRVASKYGSPHQILVAAYERAWAAFWWHEDYAAFAELYGQVEGHAKGSQNAYHLQLLSNLWFLLYGTVRRGALRGAEDMRERSTATLQSELERLTELSERPSTALQARTMLLQMRLISGVPDEVDVVLSDLEDVVRQCEGLVGYPLEPLAEILTQLGGFLGERPAYNHLFETIVEVASRREGEISAARMLLKRGRQQLDADRPYDAIHSLGRALRQLYKHESRHELVHALYLCGRAYERVGLLWAARGITLIAASVSTDELWTYDDVTLAQAACYGRMKWLELQLGRLPHVLVWHEIDRVVRSVLVKRGYDAGRLLENEGHFDGIFGMLLLRADLWQLKQLSFLPDVLEGMDLHLSAATLLYALGHEDEVSRRLSETTDPEKLHDLMTKWKDQPAGSDLPDTLLLYDEQTVPLTSTILGCRILVQSENTAPCIEIAESLLAALESLLSTAIVVDGVVAREPILTIDARRSDFKRRPFEFQMQERDGRPHVEVRCPTFDPNSLSHEEQSELKERLFDALAHILARVYLLAEPEQVLQQLFGNEVALERSINFTSSFVVQGNVLGNNPKTSLSAWAGPDRPEYALKRLKTWDEAERLRKPSAATTENLRTPALSSEEPPNELLDRGQTKHTQIKTISLIRETLWDQASWVGTAFFFSPDNAITPVLAPMFKNADAAAQIFAGWREELGEDDAEERLRVAIIRGVDRKHPHTYRVVIGVNPEKLAGPEVRYLVMVARTNTMEPSSDFNLARFLEGYKTFGRYFLAHTIVRDEGSPPSLVWDNHLVKRELHVREAWKIGRHDLDAVGIGEKDDPIISPEEKEVPVLDLLAWKRKQFSTSS